MKNSTIPETGFVRLPQILNVIPVSKSAWYLGCSQGRYPKPIRLSANTSVWRAEDIHKLIDEISAQAEEQKAA